MLFTARPLRLLHDELAANTFHVQNHLAVNLLEHIRGTRCFVVRLWFLHDSLQACIILHHHVFKQAAQLRIPTSCVLVRVSILQDLLEDGKITGIWYCTIADDGALRLQSFMRVGLKLPPGFCIFYLLQEFAEVHRKFRIILS